jgi:hypothetical protein
MDQDPHVGRGGCPCAPRVLPSLGPPPRPMLLLRKERTAQPEVVGHGRGVNPVIEPASAAEESGFARRRDRRHLDVRRSSDTSLLLSLIVVDYASGVKQQIWQRLARLVRTSDIGETVREGRHMS